VEQPDDEPYFGLTFRHSFISNALVQGIPVAVVRAWVGHVDNEVIKVDTHVHNEASQSAMRRLTDANQRGASVTKITQKYGNGSAQIQPTDKEVENDSAARGRCDGPKVDQRRGRDSNPR
jgi:hypothetical protein